MPFAIIAVTVLIVSMGYGIIAYRIADAEDNAIDVTEELKRLNESIDKTASFVNRGMGELIVSVGGGSGTLSSKADDFESSSEHWVNKQFPCFDGDVRITPLDMDVGLYTEALQTADGGRMPSYLRAEGTFTAKFECGAGTVEKTLVVRSDGSCALPLVEEMGSLFEIGLQGEGSMLSQMMSYQLTALAQERVIRGYGSLAEFGSMGTDRILTAEDVENSYRSCVTAMEMLYFRDSEEGFLTESGRIDLADLMSEDGFITLDLGAIYAQALISATDRLILQWNDYFCGNVIADFLDSVSDGVKNAWDSLVGFFTGEDTMSAAPYIREIMERNGFSESEYRYLMNGKTVSYYVPETSITRIIGNEQHTITVGGFTNVLEYPNVDIFEWDGIRNFKSEYREEHNFIREWTRGILNTAAVKVGLDRSLGRVSVPIGFDDDVPFTEDLMIAVNMSLSSMDDSLERAVENSIGEQAIYDPFYSAICEKLTQGFDSAFGVNELKSKMTEHPELSLTRQRLLNSGLEQNDVDYLMNSLYGSLYNEDIISSYETEAKKMSGRFNVLLTVPGGQSGLIKDFLTMAAEKILPAMDLLCDMPLCMTNLCMEMCDNMELSPYNGLTELPTENHFRLEAPDRSLTKEFISVADRLSPTVEILGPNSNPDDCIHYVGFNEKKGAAYCTAFRIILTDELEYSAEGQNTEAALLGVKDSFISGKVPINVDLKIPVMSGWQLAGVYGYKSSTTFYNDCWKLLLDALEPLLKPLRELLKIIQEVISIVGPALMEVANYASAVIEKLYSAIMGPLIEIRNFVEGQLDALLNRTLGGFTDVVEFIFKATLKKQTVGISFLGMNLTFSTDIASFVKNVKTVLIIGLSGKISGLSFECDLTINERSLGGGKDRYITSGVRIMGNDWDLKLKLDPMMKTGNQLASLSGVVRNTSLDVVFPYAVQYREAEIKLSDLDGIGSMLSNIPLPAAGMKGSLDAGLSLKYDIPFETGVVVNEFESNPPGDDIGNEWVELYNASGTRTDITGYTLVAGSNEKTKRMTLGEVVLAPWELYVVHLDKHMVLINDKNDVLNGECIILLDREEKEVNRSVVGKDRENNSYTWQRVADGAVDWVFAEGTPGTSNCGGFVNGELVRQTMLDIFKKSAVKNMNDMGGLLDGTEDLNEFLQRAIQDAITMTIEHISSCLIEASIFVSFDITDVTEATATGFRIALSVNTKTVSETIKYIVGELEALLFNMENPYGIDGRSLPYDNIHLAVTVYTGMNTPKFLENASSIPKMKAGVYASTNLSGLSGLFGREVGRWSVTAGILLEDCPSVLLPSKLAGDPDMQTDLWLVKAVIGRV